MRRPYLAMVMLTAGLLTACVAYPGLTDTTDTTSTGGPSTLNGGSNTTGGSSSGGNAGPTPSDPNSTDPNEPETIEGTVKERLCSRIVIIDWTAPTVETVAYFGTGSNFNSWNAGDPVELDEETGNLLNRDNGLQVQSDRLGEIDAETFLESTNQTTLTAVLADGTIWLFSSADFGREVIQWVTIGDPIAVVRDTDGSTQLINVRRCTATPATEP
jgi:hypothetical protein